MEEAEEKPYCVVEVESRVGRAERLLPLVAQVAIVSVHSCWLQKGASPAPLGSGPAPGFSFPDLFSLRLMSFRQENLVLTTLLRNPELVLSLHCFTSDRV